MNNEATISLRDFRKNAQKVIEAVDKGKTFTIIKRSRPVLKLSKPDVDEWGEEIGPNDISIDFRDNRDGVTVEEFMDALKKDLEKKQKHE